MALQLTTMNDNLRITLLKMMEADGITEARQLHYISLFTKCENDNFINGRHFEIDGKGSELPGAVRERDVLGKDQEVKWHQDYTRVQEERIEVYNS